jgi:hypothetical protein
MKNETEQKQSYLRENILNKGYEAEEFMSFLNTKKGEKGLDLNNWTMEELEETVSEFIEIKNQMDNKNNKNASQKSKKEKKEKTSNKNNNDKNQKNNNIKLINLFNYEHRR